MPKSKKKKYVENKFKDTRGYKNNSHRNKYGETRKELEQKRIEWQKEREINRNREGSIFDFLHENFFWKGNKK